LWESQDFYGFTPSKYEKNSFIYVKRYRSFVIM